MFSATVGQTLRTHRTRSGMSIKEVALAAGMTARQYEALEADSGWPGTSAFAAAVEALRIPGDARTGLDFCGRPLDTALAATLKGFTAPAIMVDHRWRVVEANPSAVRLLPDLGQPGWSLLRWVLCSPEARRHLVNAADVAETFAAVLCQALEHAPFDPDLRTLYKDLDDPLRTSGARREVDGLDLVWRTDRGPYQMVSLFVSVPARRPDLRQIVLHIEPLLLPGQEPETGQWSDAVLSGIACCGLCGAAMMYEWGPVYRCSEGCSLTVDAMALEDQVAQELLPQVYTDGTLTGLARLQEVLMACGSQPALLAPVSVRHALYQWRHRMPRAARRDLVADWIASVAVSPDGSGEADVGFRLDICWLPGLQLSPTKNPGAWPS
ncbi:helix-turn-helix domain-containing protein [Streptomyces sp. S1D4-20]|uniref:MmyB family transcriptional regulator n=1 Tax=Streptomyces sp. S1D4-20 TaxID=2594462 RepID=UPI0013DFE77A|nr:helix-turn-helix domain-containing protein [Streptomyces sp. S1D4-20]